MKVLIAIDSASLREILIKILQNGFPKATIVETAVKSCDGKPMIGELTKKLILEEPDCVILASGPIFGEEPYGNDPYVRQFFIDPYEDLKKNADEKVIFLRIGTHVKSKPKNENDYINCFSDGFGPATIVKYIKDKLQNRI